MNVQRTSILHTINVSNISIVFSSLISLSEQIMYPSVFLSYDMDDVLEKIQDLYLGLMVKKWGNSSYQMTEWKHNDMNFYGNKDD